MREIRSCCGPLILVVLLSMAGPSHTCPGAVAPAGPTAFSFAALRQRAAALASEPYRAKPDHLPEYLTKLSYDDYQSIRFRPEAGPWQGDRLRFTLQFFHRGFLYRDQVLIHLVAGGQVRDYSFSPAQFEYGTNRFPKPLPPDLHFAGFRILYPVNSPSKQDEVASFVGASYFRLLGQGQRYGVSARALAIDTAEPTGEEFPRFTEFWLEEPGTNANSIRFYALLDSPSAAGAYQFVLEPGAATTLEVESVVFLRTDVHKLGFGALTSMFLVGSVRTRYIPDYRPEVHDSDGLLLHTSADEWQWRPLINPQKTFRLGEFPGDNVKGFGLLQRRRDFCHYEDLGARYDLRPNLWLSPRESWGAGTIELVEIPTPNEYNDNIVAYWVPKEKAAAGKEFHVKYALSASLDGPPSPPRMEVHSTLLDPPHADKPPRFMINFIGSGHPPFIADAPVVANVKASRGEIKNLVVQTNDVMGGWRVFFDLVAPGDDAVELRAVLGTKDQVRSETWHYHWIP